MKTVLILLASVAILSCQPDQINNSSISKEEMMHIVRELDLQFSIGVQNKDSALLTNIYSDSAQYVIPHRSILLGKDSIGKDWAGFLRMKENPLDLVLNISDVRGNREIIYETGQGYTLLADSTRWNFNYVNVWRLQKDGTYKLEIDSYN